MDEYINATYVFADSTGETFVGHARFDSLTAYCQWLAVWVRMHEVEIVQAVIPIGFSADN